MSSEKVITWSWVQSGYRDKRGQHVSSDVISYFKNYIEVREETFENCRMFRYPFFLNKDRKANRLSRRQIADVLKQTQGTGWDWAYGNQLALVDNLMQQFPQDHVTTDQVKALVTGRWGLTR